MTERSRRGQPQPAPIPEQTAAGPTRNAAVGQLSPTDPFESIRALAMRDLEARDKTTGQLAAEFQEAIEGSQAFSWIGVYEHQDPDFPVPALEVYLAERLDQTAAARERVVDVVDAFDDLALSLEPSLSPHLHLIADSAVAQLKREVAVSRDGPGAHRLVFEDQL